MIPPRLPVPASANDKKSTQTVPLASAAATTHIFNRTNAGGIGGPPFHMIGPTLASGAQQPAVTQQQGFNPAAPGMMMMLASHTQHQQPSFGFQQQQMPPFVGLPPRPQQMDFIPGPLRWNTPGGMLSMPQPKFQQSGGPGTVGGTVPRPQHQPSLMLPQWGHLPLHHQLHFTAPNFSQQQQQQQQQALIQQHLAAMSAAASAAAAVSATPKHTSFEEPFRIDRTAIKPKEEPVSKPKPVRATKKRTKTTSSSSSEEDDRDDYDEQHREEVEARRGTVFHNDYDDEDEEDEETDDSSSSSATIKQKRRVKAGKRQVKKTKKTPSAFTSSSTINRPRRAVQDKPVGAIALQQMDEYLADDAPISSGEYNGEQRLAIDFESLGELTNPPERLGKKGVIPDGLSGSFIMYAERWFFQVRFLPAREEQQQEQESLSRYRRIEWRIKNELWKEYHTVSETYEDALKRNMRGVSLCNRAFTDAMEMRAKEFERMLKEERVKKEPDMAHIAFLESRVGVFRPKRFSEGPLLFGLRHKIVQRPGPTPATARPVEDTATTSE